MPTCWSPRTPWGCGASCTWKHQSRPAGAPSRLRGSGDREHLGIFVQLLEPRGSGAGAHSQPACIHLPPTFPETAEPYRCHCLGARWQGLGEVCFFKFGGEPKITTLKGRGLFGNIRFASKRAATARNRRNVRFFCAGRADGLRSQCSEEPPCPDGSVPRVCLLAAQVGLFSSGLSVRQSPSDEVLALVSHRAAPLVMQKRAT